MWFYLSHSYCELLSSEDLYFAEIFLLKVLNVRRPEENVIYEISVVCNVFVLMNKIFHSCQRGRYIIKLKEELRSFLKIYIETIIFSQN